MYCAVARRPDPPEELWRVPVCPECGRECEVVYRNRHMEIVGCDQCVDALDAGTVDACFPDNNF